MQVIEIYTNEAWIAEWDKALLEYTKDKIMKRGKKKYGFKGRGQRN